MIIRENWVLKDNLELTNGQYIFNFSFEDFDTCSGLLVYNNSVAVLDENEVIIGYLFQNGHWIVSGRTLEIDDDVTDAKTIKFLVDNRKVENQLLMMLYQNTGESIVVDKSEYLTPVTYVLGNFLKSVNITNLVVDYSSNELLKFNYIYIPSLHRYYYLSSFDIFTNKIYRLALSEDVLMSYKDKIKAQNAYIARTEDVTLYNKYLIDSEQLSQNKNTYEVVEITNGDSTISSDTNSEKHYLIQVI